MQQNIIQNNLECDMKFFLQKNIQNLQCSVHFFLILKKNSKTLKNEKICMFLKIEWNKIMIT